MSVSVYSNHCVVWPDSANVSVRLFVSLSMSVSGNRCLVWPDYANVSVCLIVSVSLSACNGNHCVVCPYLATVSVCLIVKVSGLTQATSANSVWLYVSVAVSGTQCRSGITCRSTVCQSCTCIGVWSLRYCLVSANNHRMSVRVVSVST